MNIIFDVDDTLYDQTQPFQKAYHDLWKDKYEINDLEKLYRISRKYSDDIFGEVLLGRMSVDESGVYRMKMAMLDFGYTISDEEALAFQCAYRHNQGDIYISDTVKALLELCNTKRVCIGVLTNGVSEHQQRKIDSLKLTKWFRQDHIFISGTIGYSKPDVKAFKYIEDTLQLNKDETYYVGDSVDNDIAGANNAGWKMIFLNRRNHNIDEVKDKVDYMVHSEEELLELIKDIISVSL